MYGDVDSTYHLEIKSIVIFLNYMYGDVNSAIYK